MSSFCHSRPLPRSSDHLFHCDRCQLAMGILGLHNCVRHGMILILLIDETLFDRKAPPSSHGTFFIRLFGIQ
jgi:hypothetical protein